MAWGPLHAETREGEALALALRDYLDGHGLTLRELERRHFPYRKSAVSERCSGWLLADMKFIRAIVRECDGVFPDREEQALKEFQKLVTAAWRAKVKPEPTTRGDGIVLAAGGGRRQRGSRGSREAVLSWLAYPQRNRRMVLNGMMGVGKSWVAREHARRHVEGGHPAWIIEADRVELVRPALARLARELGLDNGHDLNRTVREVLEQLAATEGWLLVFNEACHPDTLLPELGELPDGRGQVLITSRDPAWRRYAEPCAVTVLDRAESLALLHPMPAAAANRLADALGDLPLALVQAAALCQEGMTPDAYLDQLATDARSLLSWNRPHDYPQSVSNAFADCIGSLHEACPEASTVFQNSARSPFTDQDLTDLIPLPLRRTEIIRESQRHGLAVHLNDALHLHPLSPLLFRP